jgi:hypothetical protein
MELPWYAYVFFAVAIVLFVVQIAFKVKGAAKQLARAGKSYRRSPTPETDDEKLFALAVGAINGEQLTAYVDSLRTGVDRQRLIQGLSENWDVSSTDSARSTLAWLLGEGHRVHFSDAVAIARSPKNTWKQAAQKFQDSERMLEYAEHWSETEAELRAAGMLQSEKDVARGISSWDLGRAINLARMAYDAGYIAEDEAWVAIKQAAGLARSQFGSWNELAQSYILGRAMWSGSGMMLDGLIDIAKKLLVDAESPWIRMRWA